MSDTGDMGFGVSITFSSGFCGLIRGVRRQGITRAPIETTHAASTEGWGTFIPSDIKMAGTLEVTMLHKPDTDAPITGSTETVTLTYPVPSGLSNGATVACSGFLIDAGEEVPYDDVMLRTVTIQFTGKPTRTAAS